MRQRCPGGLARAVKLSAWIALPSLTVCGHSLVEGPECRPLGPSIALPNLLRETSGVAVGVRNPELIWTHNDGRRPLLYALDHDGRVQARVELNQSPRDWEDIARAACDLGTCLYAADTGDNEERRNAISFYRLAEPDAEGNHAVDAVRYQMELPDGPRDIEAIYVLPPDRVFFVTKGRNHPVTIYRYPPPLRSEEVVTLVEVQELTAGPAALPRMVTGASASLDGSTVAIRTYESLSFYEVVEGERLLMTDEGRVNLRSLGEVQGEGVGIGVDGEVVLSSEAAAGFGPSLTFLNCVFD